jgi:hypothetical protein
MSRIELDRYDEMSQVRAQRPQKISVVFLKQDETSGAQLEPGESE